MMRCSCFESKYSLRWSLPTLAEGLHAVVRILGDVLTLHRKMEHAVQVSQLAINCGRVSPSYKNTRQKANFRARPADQKET